MAISVHFGDLGQAASKGTDIICWLEGHLACSNRTKQIFNLASFVHIWHLNCSCTVAVNPGTRTHFSLKFKPFQFARTHICVDSRNPRWICAFTLTLYVFAPRLNSEFFVWTQSHEECFSSCDWTMPSVALEELLSGKITLMRLSRLSRVR